MDDNETLQQYFGTSTDCTQIASFGLCASNVGTDSVADICKVSCGGCTAAEDSSDSSEEEGTDAPEATEGPTTDGTFTCGTTMEECEAAYMAAMTPAVTAVMATE